MPQTILMNNSFLGARFFSEEILEILQKQEKAYEKISEEIDSVMKLLATCGWYISADSEIYQTLELGQKLTEGDIEAVDKAMSLFYEQQARAIIARLSVLYPQRKIIFSEALRAHELKMYNASTALFLSQSDGLCKGYLFKLKSNKSSLVKEIKRFENKILEEVLNVITKPSAVDAPYSEKFKYPSKLNRHAIFHGLDFDYGTHLNSLKSLSLLAFVGDFFNRYKRR